MRMFLSLGCVVLASIVLGGCTKSVHFSSGFHGARFGAYGPAHCEPAYVHHHTYQTHHVHHVHHGSHTHVKHYSTTWSSPSCPPQPSYGHWGHHSHKRSHYPRYRSPKCRY
ncbi:MAG TPA: hypothetical protein PK400_11715 [Phycisphaerales bacterium]|nr:hypothetical protein [Phycisphaerales bacterium]HRQ75636.1 hypothetical protein [Phycisphaerales bacterium]